MSTVTHYKKYGLTIKERVQFSHGTARKYSPNITVRPVPPIVEMLSSHTITWGKASIYGHRAKAIWFYIAFKMLGMGEIKGKYFVVYEY